MTYRPFGPVTGWQWGNGTTMARSYDTDGQLTAISSAGTTSYQYFLDGHIKATSADEEFIPVLTEGSTLYAVDPASNRLQSSNGLDARSYSYDAAGNTLSDGARTYSYNDSGRLATASHQGVTTSYVYSGLGERVKKSNAGDTRYFAYDEAGQLLGEYDAQGALIQETVWLGNIPVATLRPDGAGGIEIYYVHTDHLNTPRRVTRPADDVVVWRWQSLPFGASEADEDPDGDQVGFEYGLRFPGQYADGETGLFYNYYRTYDPSTGRYLESDPIGLDGGLNTYSYVSNMPTMRSDPYGLIEWNGNSYTYGAGMIGGVTKAKFVLTSDCGIDGQRVYTEIEATFRGWEAGAVVGASASGVTLTDPFPAASASNLSSTGNRSASMAGGVLSSPFGLGLSYIRLGYASDWNFGIAFGLDVSAYDQHSTETNVLVEKVIDCGCQQ